MKLLFLDIDGTLLDYDRKLPRENAEAIEKTIEEGNQVIICSGRPLHAMLPVLEELHLTGKGCYAIAFNGAQIYDCYHKRSLVRETLTMEQAAYAFRAAEEAGIHVQVYDENDTVLVKAFDRETELYTTRLKVPYREEPTLPEAMTTETVKCLFIELEDRKKIKTFRDEMEQWGQGQINVFFSNQYFLEMVKAGVDKGQAVRWFCDYMNVPIEQSVSAGDSENDLSMIEAAGVGCAVANAAEAVKEKADYVTERDCAQGAVAEIIEKFM